MEVLGNILDKHTKHLLEFVKNSSTVTLSTAARDFTFSLARIYIGK